MRVVPVALNYYVPKGGERLKLLSRVFLDFGRPLAIKAEHRAGYNSGKAERRRNAVHGLLGDIKR